MSSNKLREALNKIGNISAFVAENCGNADTAKYMNDIISIVQETLAEPLKNCDVGTAEEQTERFKDLCRKYRCGPGPRANCKGCPIQHESPHVGCTFAWAQMPYEKGEDDE